MDDSAEKLIGLLQQLCQQHGWIIALGPEDSEGNALGLVVGTEEYVDNVINGVYAEDDHEGN